MQLLLSTYWLLSVLGGDVGPEPAAMVVTSTAASVVKAGKGSPQPLAIMTVLSPGDELVTTDKGGVLVVFFADGHKELVKPRARVTVEAKRCVPVLNVTQVPGTKLSQQNIASLRELSLGARAGVVVARTIVATKLARAQPMRWETLLTDQPSFVWEEKAKVDGYLVKVFADEKPARLLWQAKTNSPRLAYPTTEKPLIPGKPYRWQVFALPTDGGSAPIVDHQFAILPLPHQRALADLKPLVESEKVEDVVLAARLYETLDAYEKALSLYERLTKLRPQEADFYTRLSNLYELAGRAEDAQATRDRAKKLLDPKKLK
jgi:hypothetical protein